MGSALERRIHDKYSSRVVVHSAIRRCPKFRTILSYVCLFSSAFLFLILMFSKAFLTFVGCTRCDGFNDFVDSYRLVIYFIAVGFYTVSYFSTMTRSFMVYVNGENVYYKTFGQRLESLDNLMDLVDFGIKSHCSDYSSYLKKKSE
ncbi:hypothetical protein WA588_004141 [Blastocystis sp. NMH]